MSSPHKHHGAERLVTAATPRRSADLTVTPLIDVLLVLLIIFMTALPLSHAFGLITSIVGAFVEEPGTYVLMRWFEPVGWLRLAAEHRATGSQLVPSMLALLLRQRVEEYDLSALRYISVGAAPLPPAVRAEWERRAPSTELEITAPDSVQP